MYFLTGFQWVSTYVQYDRETLSDMEFQYESLQPHLVDRDSNVDDETALKEIQFLAWSEVAGAVHERVDPDRGILLWRDVVNNEMPHEIRVHLFGVDTLEVDHVCQIAGIKPARFSYLRAKRSKLGTSKSIPTMADVLRRAGQ